MFERSLVETLEPCAVQVGLIEAMPIPSHHLYSVMMHSISRRSMAGPGTGQALRGPGLLRPQQPISAGGRPRFAEVDLIPRLRLDAEQPLCDAKSKHQEHEDLCEHGRVLCLVCSTIAVKRRLLALAANSCDRQHVFAFYGILPTMVRCQDALAAARRLVTTPSASPCQGMVRLPRWTGEPW